MDEKKRKFHNEENTDYGDKVYKFHVLLPNGIAVDVIRRNPKDSMSLESFIHKVKERCFIVLRQTENLKPMRKVLWDHKELYLQDIKGNRYRNQICFDTFMPNKTHILTLFDGAHHSVNTFENMWDLTPDTDLLTELPDDYTFETALADLIDNSLQAVWSNGKGERKLIRVEVNEDEVSIFDSGPGMDGSDEHSIVKWGKMGASVHRSSKKLAIGGRPPFLVPYFGMFGYGGTIASMHLGRHAIVSAKTKESKKVYWLRLEREALLKRSGSDLNWKAAGGIRDPSDMENELSPHGSFTKIVMKPKLKLPDIYQLQCKLKDIYFPYIQCDEISKSGRTTTLVDFQINDTNLAEIEGGEVAVTNLHSCNGPDFVINLHFSIEEDEDASKSPGVNAVREGNARLKCVYFPIIEGKENIDRILEKLNSDGVVIKENFTTFSRISIRRLGRLLPEARWGLLPFMQPIKRGGNAHILKECCSRVKCFIDTDAGFNPIPSKTDLAPHHPFTKALKELGAEISLREKVVKLHISRCGKELTLQRLEREYQDWILQMHSKYDDDCNLGIDEPDVIVDASNAEELGISTGAWRVHKAISRKGKSWNRGQKVKILKGAGPGCHKNNIFATLEYFLLEGIEENVGGEARVICRPLGVEDGDGSVLTVTNDSCPNLKLGNSISLPIMVIDSGKCTAVSDNEWNNQANKLSLKVPSSIQILGKAHCKFLDIDGALPTDASAYAGSIPPSEVVAVLRPSNFVPSHSVNDLDQKYILRDHFEMSLDVTFKAATRKSTKIDQIFSGTVTPSSRKGYHGLYIFSISSIQGLFQKSGVYTFSFRIKKSAASQCVIECEKVVKVNASPNVKRWELSKDDHNVPLIVSVGSSFPSLLIARYDRYDNIIPFEVTPKIGFQLISKSIVLSLKRSTKVELSLDKSRMKVSNTRVTTDKLDDIRPSYEATLALSQPNDKKPFLRIPCQVFPGPPYFVRFHMSESGKELLPNQVVDDMRLEVLDRHRNHVQGGTEIELELYGFSFMDEIGRKRKVDDDGFIDLSDLLTVTGCYGNPVSLAIISNEKTIATKKFQVEKRQLRLATMIPEVCQPGSTLKDLSFEVVDSIGNVDITIHDSEKYAFHTLRISSDFGGVESIRYAFKHGRCIIPSITLPYKDGCFFIKASHSRHSELQLKFQILVSSSLVEPRAPHVQASKQHSLSESFSPHSVSLAGNEFHNLKATIINSQRDPDCDVVSPLRTQSLNHGVSASDTNFVLASGKVSPVVESKVQKQSTLAETPEKYSRNYGFNDDIIDSPAALITGADTYTPKRAISLIGPDLSEDFESMENDFFQSASEIKCLEDDLKWCVLHKEELEENLTQLQASKDLLPALDYISPTEVMLDKIEKKVDSAASIYSIASRNVRLKSQQPEFMADVVGLVALLATVSTPELSRSLAEYLGEDQMLAIVCQSNVALTTPDKYKDVLMSLAGEVGQRIKHRQHIICLEDLSTYAGGVLETDPQRRLALPNPILLDGTTPHGFLGYAVNLIDIVAEHRQTKTVTGHGLRETLFYRLFGELQVYKTNIDMILARVCITDGAISLEGGAIHGKGIINLISGETGVCFPIVLRDPELVMEKMKSDIDLAEKAIEVISQSRSAKLKIFHEKKDQYTKIIEDKEKMQKVKLLENTRMSMSPSHMKP
ncbi:unnamed protein product [Amaranthus hypochondriacus]